MLSSLVCVHETRTWQVRDPPDAALAPMRPSPLGEGQAHFPHEDGENCMLERDSSSQGEA